MTNITGIKNINIVASTTFPSGINITQFADDTDPLDSPAIDIQGNAMGANGDLIVWNSPNPIPANIGVIANSDDDTNLRILFNANRKAKNKVIANDMINMVITYNDDSIVSLSAGAIVNGQALSSSTSENRLKTNVYSFVFEDVVS